MVTAKVCSIADTWAIPSHLVLRFCVENFWRYSNFKFSNVPNLHKFQFHNFNYTVIRSAVPANIYIALEIMALCTIVLQLGQIEIFKCT